MYESFDLDDMERFYIYVLKICIWLQVAVPENLLDEVVRAGEWLGIKGMNGMNAAGASKESDEQNPLTDDHGENTPNSACFKHPSVITNNRFSKSSISSTRKVVHSDTVNRKDSCSFSGVRNPNHPLVDADVPNKVTPNKIESNRKRTLSSPSNGKESRKSKRLDSCKSSEIPATEPIVSHSPSQVSDTNHNICKNSYVPIVSIDNTGEKNAIKCGLPIVVDVEEDKTTSFKEVIKQNKLDSPRLITKENELSPKLSAKKACTKDLFDVKQINPNDVAVQKNKSTDKCSESSNENNGSIKLPDEKCGKCKNVKRSKITNKLEGNSLETVEICEKSPKVNDNKVRCNLSDENQSSVAGDSNKNPIVLSDVLSEPNSTGASLKKRLSPKRLKAGFNIKRAPLKRSNFQNPTRLQSPMSRNRKFAINSKTTLVSKRVLTKVNENPYARKYNSSSAKEKRDRASNLLPGISRKIESSNSLNIPKKSQNLERGSKDFMLKNLSADSNAQIVSNELSNNKQYNIINEAPPTSVVGSKQTLNKCSDSLLDETENIKKLLKSLADKGITSKASLQTKTVSMENLPSKIKEFSLEAMECNPKTSSKVGYSEADSDKMKPPMKNYTRKLSRETPIMKIPLPINDPFNFTLPDKAKTINKQQSTASDLKTPDTETSRPTSREASFSAVVPNISLTPSHCSIMKLHKTISESPEALKMPPQSISNATQIMANMAKSLESQINTGIIHSDSNFKSEQKQKATFLPSASLLTTTSCSSIHTNPVASIPRKLSLDSAIPDISISKLKKDVNSIEKIYSSNESLVRKVQTDMKPNLIKQFKSTHELSFPISAPSDRNIVSYSKRPVSDESTSKLMHPIGNIQPSSEKSVASDQSEIFKKPQNRSSIIKTSSLNVDPPTGNLVSSFPSKGKPRQLTPKFSANKYLKLVSSPSVRPIVDAVKGGVVAHGTTNRLPITKESHSDTLSSSSLSDHIKTYDTAGKQKFLIENKSGVFTLVNPAMSKASKILKLHSEPTEEKSKRTFITGENFGMENFVMPSTSKSSPNSVSQPFRLLKTGPNSIKKVFLPSSFPKPIIRKVIKKRVEPSQRSKKAIKNIRPTCKNILDPVKLASSINIDQQIRDITAKHEADGKVMIKDVSMHMESKEPYKLGEFSKGLIDSSTHVDCDSARQFSCIPIDSIKDSQSCSFGNRSVSKQSAESGTPVNYPKVEPVNRFLKLEPRTPEKTERISGNINFITEDYGGVLNDSIGMDIKEESFGYGNSVPTTPVRQSSSKEGVSVTAKLVACSPKGGEDCEAGPSSAVNDRQTDDTCVSFITLCF